mmetsp:Transcript_12162/g.28379  ORF Transcript_12162/g.28379 Transcript_12162/m.28379 type:complete len:395 (-) Transcript_12162:30-1214(-)
MCCLQPMTARRWSLAKFITGVAILASKVHESRSMRPTYDEDAERSVSDMTGLSHTRRVQERALRRIVGDEDNDTATDEPESSDTDAVPVSEDEIKALLEDLNVDSDDCTWQWGPHQRPKSHTLFELQMPVGDSVKESLALHLIFQHGLGPLLASRSSQEEAFAKFKDSLAMERDEKEPTTRYMVRLFKAFAEQQGLKGKLEELSMPALHHLHEHDHLQGPRFQARSSMKAKNLLENLVGGIGSEDEQAASRNFKNIFLTRLDADMELAVKKFLGEPERTWWPRLREAWMQPKYVGTILTLPRCQLVTRRHDEYSPMEWFVECVVHWETGYGTQMIIPIRPEKASVISMLPMEEKQEDMWSVAQEWQTKFFSEHRGLREELSHMTWELELVKFYH